MPRGALQDVRAPGLPWRLAAALGGTALPLLLLAAALGSVPLGGWPGFTLALAGALLLAFIAYQGADGAIDPADAVRTAQDEAEGGGGLEASAERLAGLAASGSAGAREDEALPPLGHLLRTPVNAMLGFSTLLGEEVDGPLDPEQRQAVEAMVGAAERLADLLGDVLELCGGREATIPVRCRAVEVERVLGAAVRELRGLAPDGVTVRLEPPPGGLEVRADPRRLLQVLVNLGANALAAEGTGEVLLSARVDEAGTRVVLSVADDGPGIAEPERLLRPFERGEGGGEGFGLGLAVVRHLVDRQGGRLRVDRGRSRGTCWRIELPVDEREGVPK